MTLAGKWLPAGQYLGALTKAAMSGGDWRGDWIEAEIIGRLASGELTARGRRLAFDKLHPHQIDPEWRDLISGSDRKPKLLPVAEIPAQFWREFAHFSGAQWPHGSSAAWQEASFNCGPDRWESVEILEPKPRRGGGRPPAYDWPAIEAEMMRLLECEGGLSAEFNQADLESAAAQWTLDNFGRQPAPSNIRQHAQAVIRKFRDAKTVC